MAEKMSATASASSPSEAARALRAVGSVCPGVRRLVLASSGQVNWWQRMSGNLPVRVQDPPSPRYWYAATKAFMEAAGRAYSEAHGMSVIVARLGWCPRTPEQVQEKLEGAIEIPIVIRADLGDEANH